MRVKRWDVALCGALVLLVGLTVRTSRAGGTQTDEALGFAGHLLRQGDYYRAITEYERAIYLSSGDLNIEQEARLGIAMSYLRGGKPDEAARRLVILSNEWKGSEKEAEILLALAEAQGQRGDHRLAEEALTRTLATALDSSATDSARIQLIWTRLRLGNSAGAREVVQGIPEENVFTSRIPEILDEIRSWESLPQRSPGLAGTLSALLPGAGQLYLGRFRDACTAFLLNALVLWGAVDELGRGEIGTSAVFLTVESVLYLGNVYNAVNGAHKLNRQLREEKIDSAQNKFKAAFGVVDGSARIQFAFLF